ncbi:WG repeat-containing protein [Wenyingzhuangia sp. 2_MG-2023]|uniref:WG repeat-containing protein n=1 Tax=Wenyingzhuangia sp. 2_MG-2023 TaxID=3062639 RepID=UPI0026E37250|nr:WG repeat-containing protein [Wenyingzhuangia sp. 2_MG-2023]MDO6739184.1 WG repeat-containing protein [Wenyingzhuangia sp. 2_MG-2023]
MKKLILINFIIFFNTNLFSQETKCECYSKSGIKEKHGIGAWTSVIGENENGETLQYHFYSAYFPPQELCIPRDDIWWRKVNGAILKAIKTHPIYKSSQVAIKKGHFTANAEQLTGQAFITQSEINRIKANPGTIVHVDAYLHTFANKLSLCDTDNLNEDPKIQPSELSKNENSTIINSPSNSINDEKQIRRTAKEKQLADAQNFIAKQNAASENYNTALKNLGNTLTTQFTEISNNWAKEQDYINQISSLSQINSTNVDGIIREAKQKQRQLEIVFDRKSRDLERELATSRTQVLAAAKNETQAAVGELLATTAIVMARRKLEKNEREARQNLERQKEKELSKIAEKLKNKYLPQKKEAFKAAILAVSEEAETYYLEKYEFADCMIEDAANIILGNRNYCDDPGKQKFVNNRKKNTSKIYYDAYKRKSKSRYDEFKENAPYFLELALQKNPKNTAWLYEKSQLTNIELIDKLAILKKITLLDSKNSTYKNAYKETLDSYKDLLNQQRIYEEQKSKYGSDIIRNTLLNLVHENYNWDSHENLKLIHVRDYNEIFFINQKGETILEVSNYNSVTDFNEGLALVSKDGLYGFINSLGEIVIPIKYLGASNLSEGLAAIQDPTTQLWGYTDSKGNLVIPFAYSEADSFSEDLAFVKKKVKEGKWILSNSLYIDPKYQACYINKKNEIAVKERFDTGTPFKNGIAQVKRYTRNDSFMGGGKDKTYFIDKNGKKISQNKSNLASSFNPINGYAILKKGKYYVIINNEGKIVSELKFHNIPKFIDGIAIVSTSTAWRAVFGTYTKYGYVHYTGKTISKIKYTSAKPFVDGKALVELDGQTFYIDKEGNTISD